MNKRQFKNLNLFTLQYPFTAIISILHRLSGILVYLFIPFLLWLLDVALSSAAGFEHINTLLMNPVSRFFSWLFLAALGYHLLAGIRHLVMDMGLGESLRSGRWSGMLVLLLAIIWAICIGTWLW